jgi:hypothetical protein
MSDNWMEGRIAFGTLRHFELLEARWAEMRAEIERLRAALQEISEMCGRDPVNPFLADDMERVARRALEGK